MTTIRKVLALALILAICLLVLSDASPLGDFEIPDATDSSDICPCKALPPSKFCCDPTKDWPKPKAVW